MEARRYKFTRRTFRNNATDWIQSTPEATITDFLCFTSDMVTALQEDSEIVIEFLNSQCSYNDSPPMYDMKRIEMIAMWALTTSLNTHDIDLRWKLYQINRNACEIMLLRSHKIRRLISSSKYITQLLSEFSNESNADQGHPVIAANFARIVQDMMAARGALELGFISLKNLIELCIKNIHICAYQDLLYSIGEELHDNDTPGTYNIGTLLRHILIPAAFMQRRHIPLKGKARSLYKSLRKEYHAVLHHHYCEEECTERSSLLLMTVQRLVDSLSDEELGKVITEEHIELLLVSGVYSDELSVSGKTAFRMLKRIIYLIPEQPESVTKLIDSYAKRFKFTQQVTGHMMAAFPIFWNHRYEECDDGKEYEPVELQNEGIIQEPIPYVHTRPKGLTPLEMYGRFLLDGPLSDQFLRDIVFVVSRLVDRANAKRRTLTTRNVTKESFVELLKLELIVFEFTRTRMDYKNNHDITFMAGIEHVIMELDSWERVFDSDNLVRTRVNCFLLPIWELLSHTELYTFNACFTDLAFCCPGMDSIIVERIFALRDFLRRASRDVGPPCVECVLMKISEDVPEANMSDNVPEANTSENVSDYIIEASDITKGKKLGEGRFGSVHLCSLNGRPQESLAVKEVKIPQDNDSESFQREIENLAKLHHPTILRLVGVTLPIPVNGEYVGSIVTEFLSYGSLHDILNRIRENDTPSFWTPTCIAKILTGFAVGMRYVHKRDIIHRDLKPANLLMDDKHHIRIADFGISRSVDDMSLSMTKGLGTVWYQSPEIFQGNDYTNKIDVYAFGVIAYELLTGKRAFNCPSRYKVGENVCNGIRPEIPTTIHESVRSIISQCWSVNPKDRPSFDDIVQTLASINFMITPDVSRTEVSDYYKELIAYESK